MSKRRRSLIDKPGAKGAKPAEGEAPESGEGPFTVPDDFEDEHLPREGTEERIKRVLEGGAVEVTEKASTSHNFIREATEDTGDDAWDNSIHAGRRAPGFYDEPEPEPEPEAPKAVPATAPEPVDKGTAPDFFAAGSVDSDNPISFIDNPVIESSGGPGGTPEPEPEPEEPEESISFIDEAPSDPAPVDFLAPEEEPAAPAVDFLDGPIGGEAFFGGADPQPPTEEVPSAILDDVSQPSSIPSMSGGLGYEAVPEAGIEEMVIGAPTPPPAVREQAPEPPDLREQLRSKAQETYEDEDEDEGMGLPVIPILILGGMLVMLSGLGFVLWSLASGPDLEHAERTAISSGLAPPIDIPEVALPDVMRPNDPRDIPSADNPIEDAMAQPLVVEEEAATAPRPAAAPRKRKAAAAASPKPGGLGSKILVTSNRRVLIYLDGQPQGYSPLEIMVGEGSYTLSASLPGRTETEQVKTVDVARGATEKMGFMF